LKSNGGQNHSEKKRSDKVRKKRRAKELSAALDSAEEQMREEDNAGPHRAAKHKVICMVLAIRGRTEVALRFIDY
jgi:hypothetical protein